MWARDVYLTGDYDVSDYDVHVLTGAVKLLFRELSEPLIPVQLLDQFITTYRTYQCLYTLNLQSALNLPSLASLTLCTLQCESKK